MKNAPGSRPGAQKKGKDDEKKRVRKITAILLAVSMVLGVSGCGKKSEKYAG